MAEPTLLIAGASPAEVAHRLDSAPPAADSPGDGSCRLAVVDPTEARLALARKVVNRGQPWRGRNDVWFSGRPLLGGADPGRIAWLFPGFEPEPAGSVQDVADHFGLPRPVLVAGTPDNPGIIGPAVDIVSVNRLLAQVLDRLGVRPDLLAGHSLGEWTAMIVSGMVDFRSIDALFSAVREGRASFPEVAYAALGCPAEQAAAAIAGLEGVFVSHDNCPHQAVLCGWPGALDRALEILRGGGVLGQPMAFRSGFHTPLLGPCLEASREAFARLAPHHPAIPVWSATSVSPYPADSAALRELVVRHLLEPVRFRELIEALYAQGVRAFVQVGSGSLTGFVEDTLGKREHLAIAAQHPARTGLEQLARVAAALWVEQAPAISGRLPAAQGRAATPPVARLVAPLVTTASPVLSAPPAPAPLPVLSAPPAPAPAPLPAQHPVLVAFQAAMAEAAQAAREVTEAWSRRPAQAPAAQAPAVRAEPPAAPAVAPAPQPGHHRLFSLQTMPELRDHCLFRQAPGWGDDSDQFPVVPMTTLLEIMGDAAREAYPTLTVVGLSRVRALRWLAVAPAVTVPIEVSVAEPVKVSSGYAEVKVVITGYAEGVVELSAAYPAAPAPARWPLANPREPEVSAEQLYRDGWMFHGPGFQGVTEISQFGDDGILGSLICLPASGALLDAAGQLAGHWAQAQASVDRLAFPTSIGGVRLFGPHPRPGDRLQCAVQVRSFSEDTLKVDIEVQRASGAVWARIDGWTCRRFATDEITWPAVHTRPAVNTLGQPQPGGWCLVRDRWPDRATQEYTMRRYLNAPERAEFDSHNPRAQRTWLLGRIAAKDAARRWLWSHGHGPLLPAQISVGNDAQGRPWVRTPGAALSVSLAHTAGVAVAMVIPAGSGPVGVDVEAIVTAASARTLADVALTDRERQLIDRLSGSPTGPDPLWLTRFWSIKEAAAKAEGTGLAGRPRDFEVVEVDGDLARVSVRDQSLHEVRSTVLASLRAGEPGHAVAWTTQGVDGPLPRQSHDQERKPA